MVQNNVSYSFLAGQKLKWGLQTDVKNFLWLWLSGFTVVLVWQKPGSLSRLIGHKIMCLKAFKTFYVISSPYEKEKQD